MTNSTTIAVVGLGYVGLPLAVEFGKQFPTIGFDLVAGQDRRVPQRRRSDRRGQPRRPCGCDRARSHERCCGARSGPTSSSSRCRRRSTTRTSPISGRCSVRANRSAGTFKRGAIVVFESTVYPGATEEICVPVIERHSGMQWRRDFFVGYSPERINPGDREHSLTRITKVVVRRHAGDARARRERSTAASSRRASTVPRRSRSPRRRR